MPTLILGKNTFGTLAQATEYFDSSSRGAPWLNLGTDDQKRALITAFREFEKLTWSGAATGVEYAVDVTTNVSGAGHVVGERLTAQGGTGAPIILVVTAVAAGAVSQFEIIAPGGYSVVPGSPVTFLGSIAGTGFITDVTFEAQSAAWPRTGVTNRYGIVLASDTTPRQVIEAQFELSLDISQDPSVAEGNGTGSNIKKVTAGAVDVEFFRFEEGSKLPRVALSMISELLGGGGAGSAGSLRGSVNTGGPGGTSIYETQIFGRTEGFS